MNYIKILVLPGFSIHNKDWALEIKKRLSFRQSVLIHEWQHWKLGGSLHSKNEIKQILKEIRKDEINVIAKSVGTMICMYLLNEVPNQISKIILCGIPSVSKDRKNLFITSLSDFDSKGIVVFQNTKDPFASYLEVKNFMKDVNSKIKVIEKERSDHNYPYFEDFKNFLS